MLIVCCSIFILFTILTQDLYDSDSSGSGIGCWCLMADSWGFDGSHYYPPIMSAWSRKQLGWDTYTEITKDGLYSIDDAGAVSSGNPQIYKIQGSFPSNEFLLIENRQLTGFEQKNPTTGLAIYHIDNMASYDTEGYPGMAGWPANGQHYRVALLQRDGNYDLEKGLLFGDSGDLWRSGHELLPSTNILTGPFPNTDAYRVNNVFQTGIKITKISSSESTMTFRVTGLGCSSNSDCDDGDSCSGTETCNLTTNQCQAGIIASPGTTCDDSELYIAGDTCNGSGTCVSGSSVVISPTCYEASLSVATPLCTSCFVAGAHDGMMFDVQAKNSDVLITSLSASIYAGGTFEMWTKPGSHVGYEVSSLEWTKIKGAHVYYFTVVFNRVLTWFACIS